MVSQLTDDLKDIGKYSEDAVESDLARADVGELVQTINEYNVVADPEKERYIVNDDEHQYSVQVDWTDMGDEDEVVVYMEESHTGFNNEALKNRNVMTTDEIIEDPQDGALYRDGGNAFAASADGAPDRVEQKREKTEGEILEPETETGWGVADNL